MKRYFSPRQVSWVLSLFLIPSLACDLSFVADILSRIDTTPTDCAATVFTVTLTDDLSRDMCNRQCSLRDAIQAANDCPGDDSIQLGAGTYSLRLRGLDGNRGDLDITGNVAIIGVSPDDTIIHVASGWDDHIFEIHAGVRVSMHNLAISGANLLGGQGGGIYNAGDLALQNVALQDNSAYGGGGLYNTGIAHLTNVQVTGNTALADFSIGRDGYWLPYPDGGSTTACGGGIANAGTMDMTGGSVSQNYAAIGAGICNALGGILTINGTTISTNGSVRALPAMGGGIATFSGLTISAATIGENYAALGGGLYLLAPRAAEITLDDVTVQGNHASDDGGGSSTASARAGGGLYVKSGTFTILHSRIVDNASAGDGGGIYVEPGSGARSGSTLSDLGYDYGGVTGTIRQSSIARNTAGSADGVGNGGGISYYGLFGSAGFELENVTISTNTAHNIGGAIYLKFLFGGARLTNVTVASNWAETTSGIDLDDGSQLYLKNSLIAHNEPWNCRVEGGAITSEGYNVSQGNLCHLTATGDIEDISILGNMDPALSEVGNQFVHVLYPGGRPVDWINSMRCPAQDQRGVARPQGARCDVGAYELQVVPSSLQITPIVIPTETPTPQAIPQVVLLQNANCRKGPGLAYDIVTAFEKGMNLQPLARNEQNTWSQVAIPTGSACWLADSNLDKPGAPDGLPVLPAPPLPDVPATFSDKGLCNPQVKTRSVQLSWSKVPNATGYRLYRGGVLLVQLGANISIFVDSVSPGKDYLYELEAINAYGSSERLKTSVSRCK